MAQPGLGQDAMAKAKLREALRVDPRLMLSTREFPPAFVAFFEETRKKILGSSKPRAWALRWP